MNTVLVLAVVVVGIGEVGAEDKGKKFVSL